MVHQGNTPDPTRIEELVITKCNGALSSSELTELEKWLTESSEARAMYWEHMSIHAGLRWIHNSKSECDNRLALLGDEEATTTYQLASNETSAFSSVNKFLWSFVVAASVLAAFWLVAKSQESDGPLGTRSTGATETANIVGVLTPLSTDAHWSFGLPGDEKQHEFSQGDTVWLDRGAAELKLAGGTVAQLEAPLILKMDSAYRARVLRGRITVDVPTGEEGFTVETTAAEVIDLGTTFSVDVTDGGDTDVIVFSGKVDVNPSQHHDFKKSLQAVGSTTRLHTGEAVRVGQDGTLSRIVNVRRNAFANHLPKTTAIKEVRDNVVRQQTMKYYEIVARGMREDAAAFVDRNYQWNGLRTKGLPEYLRNGDYVKTFNDDKVSEDIVITVTLERPSSIYLLVDDRLQDTSWLEDQFVDTGDDIGVDEGPHIPNDIRRLASGPGLSIDQVHSIWKCRENGVTAITIGPRGPVSIEASRLGTKAKVNMFGIVAVALLPEQEITDAEAQTTL